MVVLLRYRFEKGHSYPSYANIQFVIDRKHSVLQLDTKRLIMMGKFVCIYCEIQKQHTNTLHWENTEYLIVTAVGMHVYHSDLNCSYLYS